MPKVRKRKIPITNTTPSTTSLSSESTRAIIRQFHALLKRRAHLLDRGVDEASRKALANVEQQIEELGGLKAYQHMSTIGQGDERGGGSEKVLITWLQGLGMTKSHEGSGRLRLLEVGALKPDNYHSCSSWIECVPIDLRSRHPSIKEQDFLLMCEDENREKWDIISLSLVLNFVPRPNDRGRMLKLAHAMLKPEGHLFLVLPLPCVQNSRYLDFEHMGRIMRAVGFTQRKERWKKGGKIVYWLFQKCPRPSAEYSTALSRKNVFRQGNRNNFSILL
ncbi:hypothetical protein AX17_003526 [Amanita inopinata Kibby_2008]|nr:hypothetical protein AX17_003526 [Amanita inopinata Kibby_2008]